NCRVDQIGPELPCVWHKQVAFHVRQSVFHFEKLVTPVLTWLILKTICSIASAVRQGDQWVWVSGQPNEKPTGKARVEEIHQDRADG
ncbi:hypothetical protein ALC56_12124, partial [Trachymyrmex septentrionalis]